MSNRDKKFVGNNWLELSDLTIFEAAFWMRIGCEPPDLKYIELFAGYPDITESLSDYNPDWEFDVFETGDVVASAVRAGLIRVTADISNGGKFDFKHTRINKSDWLDWCRNHGYSELADCFIHTDNPAQIEILHPSSPSPSIIQQIAPNNEVEVEPATPFDEKAEAGLTKREKQIRVIEKLADELQYPRNAIPVGGKKILMHECKEKRSDIFGAGDDPFLEAWQLAVDTKRIRMKHHESYARK